MEHTETEDLIQITQDEAEQLLKCLGHTYVSHEDYPLVIDLLRRLRQQREEYDDVHRM